MDVIIENKKDGTSLELEIWYFSTVLKIKEKIHKHHGVPVDKQTLYISGVAMEDDRDAVYYEVAQGSKIELVVHQDDQEEEQESLEGGDDEVMETEEDNVVNQDEEEIQEGLVAGHEVVSMEGVLGQEEGLVGGHEVVTMGDVLGQQQGLVGGHKMVTRRNVSSQQQTLQHVLGQQQGLQLVLGQQQDLQHVLGQQQGLGGGHEVVTRRNVLGQQQGLVGTGSKEVVVVEDDAHDYQRKGKGKSNTFKSILNVLAKGQQQGLLGVLGQQQGLVGKMVTMGDILGQQLGLQLVLGQQQGLQHVLGQQQGLGGGHEVVTRRNVLGQQQGLVGTSSKEVVVAEDDADYQRKGKGKSNTVKIIVNVLSMRKRFELNVEDGKTVEQLQQMINVEPLTVGRKALLVGGVEMEDAQRTLRDYGVVEGTEVVVLLMITVNVRGYTKTEKIIDVEVNMTDNVSELREKLKRLKDLHQLVLLDVGFVFIHKQEAMDEGRSFLWHEVKHNHTIDAFPNFVTGGED